MRTASRRGPGRPRRPPPRAGSATQLPTPRVATSKACALLMEVSTLPVVRAALLLGKRRRARAGGADGAKH